MHLILSLSGCKGAIHPSMQKKIFNHPLPAAAKSAFPHTLPVMAGYVFLGTAFGILLKGKGYGPVWALSMSLFIYAGSMQFVAAGLLAAAFSPLTALAVTLLVNARHLFYGLTMLEPFSNMGWRKPYMVFSLTDETYALFSGMKAPITAEERDTFFLISLLNQSYWVLGSLLGSLVGEWLTFDAGGIAFAMTALFIVIFVEQWLGTEKEKAVRGFFRAHCPAVIGVGVSVISLMLFGPDQFLLPAMGGLLILFTVLRKYFEKAVAE
jgi:4-azaleucine resistance transporter AzlC